MQIITLSALIVIGIVTAPVYARESHWFTTTIDNDLLVGADNGYTNGIYFSWIEAGVDDDVFAPGWMVYPLAWSISMDGAASTLNTYNVGQVMVTPEDITIENPPLDDIPYSGTLLFNHTFIVTKKTYADAIASVVGITGPSSGAEATQKWVHELSGANDPKGWDTQLQDELVFQFSRGRLWRTWAAADDRQDFLTVAEAGIGTLSSFVSYGALYRYGRNMSSTFETPLLINSRTANPAAIEGGWYVYAGIKFEYVFNQIFTDGNTFRDSRLIEYDRSVIGATAGLAYSWQDFSITIALFDSDITGEISSGLTRFGALTLGWRY